MAKKKDLLEQYKKYLKKNPKLIKIMRQLEVDQESYLDALYQMDSSKIIPERIYTDSTS